MKKKLLSILILMITSFSTFAGRGAFVLMNSKHTHHQPGNEDATALGLLCSMIIFFLICGCLMNLPVKVKR